jgi:hypothetical protein
MTEYEKGRLVIKSVKSIIYFRRCIKYDCIIQGQRVG